MTKEKTLSKEELELLHRYWMASNYLAVGQLYLLENPLLKEPLTMEMIKPAVVGHWGTIPGQNFLYTHLNRVINKYDLDMIYISGPGHGGNAMVAHTYMEGTYTEIYPQFTEDEEGMQKLFKHFSFPGGMSSHVAPEVPGSINEGGELGYSLAHAFGAVYDNPDLIAACVVGDGEAETGPLAGSWHANTMLNPINDGAVLPILHLNGYKIANPTVFARISDEELKNYFKGKGYSPIIVEAFDWNGHEALATALDKAIERIKAIQKYARENNDPKRPKWPMIIFKNPKGWTCPEIVEDEIVAGTWRSHQVPVVISKDKPENVTLLEAWMKSYEPETLFDEEGRLMPELKALAPKGNKRMGANPHANGGILLKDLNVPDFKQYELPVPKPGAVLDSDMTILGNFVRDIVKYNPENFRIFGPDEFKSNRLQAVYKETNKQWVAGYKETDEYMAPAGRVIDGMLNEHLCQGMLEGYLLTGRHGFFHTYEAFVRIVDSMASQHAKWLKIVNDLSWRRDIASFNYILTSHTWQQDHNGYTHQNPGFLNHLVTHKAEITRIYLPPDANTLLSTFNHCIKSKNYINVIVASKHDRPQWLTMKEAVEHCTAGVGIWQWASNDNGEEPDLVMAGCGQEPTLEALAAIKILRENFPELKIRMVNVVDLMRLESPSAHPHGLEDSEYDAIFTKDKPIIFAFHGYPNLVHQLTYKRTNKDLHVHGYNEEGTITTPFDMRVQNKLDRFHLVINALKHLNNLGNRGAALNQWCKDKLIEHKEYIKEHGTDLPEIKNWQW